MATMTHDDGKWFWIGNTYSIYQSLKTEGFRCAVEKNGGAKSFTWWTDVASVAARFAEYADERAKTALASATAKTAASRAQDADVEIPAPAGLAFMPFQQAGVAWLRDHKNTLLSDSPGLGKTIQVVGLLNIDASINRVLLVVPASLKINWKREIERWSTRPLKVVILEGRRPSPIDPAANVLIANYDIVSGWLEPLKAAQFDLLVLDEAHKIKNARTAWTKAIVEIAPSCKRRVIVTGTPIKNRPVELITQLRLLESDLVKSWRYFVTRYCNGHQQTVRTQGGGQRMVWITDGESNLPELQDRLRSTVMIRRLKADVLVDLPAKRRTVLCLPKNGAANTVGREKDGWGKLADQIAEVEAIVAIADADEDRPRYEEAVAKLRRLQFVAFEEIARLRHDTALAKLPAAATFLVDQLEGGLDKVVVFAHHHDVIDGLREALAEYGPVTLTGDDSAVARDEAVSRFQADPTCRVFLGSITAAGVGLTLTAAHTVVFVEATYVPSEMQQCEDRCHRIGQRDAVDVIHLVLDGSIDADMAHKLVEKQDVIDRALDKFV